MFGTESEVRILPRTIAFILDVTPIYVSCIKMIGSNFFGLIDEKKEKISKIELRKIEESEQPMLSIP